MMKRTLQMCLVAALLTGGGGFAFAADPMKDKGDVADRGRRITMMPEGHADEDGWGVLPDQEYGWRTRPVHGQEHQAR